MGCLELMFPVFSPQPAGELPESQDSCLEAQLWEDSVAGPGSLALKGGHEPGQERSLPPDAQVKISESASFQGERLLW